MRRVLILLCIWPKLENRTSEHVDWVDSSKRRNDAENLTLLNKSFDDINVRFSALFQRLEEST